MSVVYVSGVGDDLIEIEGDLEVEFYVKFDQRRANIFLAFSDGSLLNIFYDDQGIWRIQPVAIDRSTDYFKEFEAQDPDSERYSDLVRLSNPDGFKWVLKGSEWSSRQRTRKDTNFPVEGP